ncbi:alpha/beta fold hydrolase [Lysobacter sp. BMK333-48F3]|uniref:alpha/beta fold hydrolase n=1 Tax=Lysobacter sp. BMK333-48F3 TaxID=2867962 RepID=UPI001C8B46D6|nr:alpha/beta hydrolase [Lysobacter sp. BMK333-48F3]MBX9401504.1 alpha/beta fold hydrolase [Lysobacter sp. BMK333-48F3]
MAVKSEDKFVELEDVKLCYRVEGDPSNPPVLLIMGLNSQLIHWPQALVDKLKEDHYVIRFDNRDSGLTTWRTGEPPADGYRLADMAKDTVQLIEHLGIDRPDVIGASMGGMIAQRLVIDHPTYARSLCSIMSTTGSILVGQPQPGVIEELLKQPPSDREGIINHTVALFNLIGSKTHAASEAGRRRALAEAAYDRSTAPDGTPLHPGGGARQIGAILLAGNRTKDLNALTLPTLVIHGNEDALINVSGGRATRDAVPGAQWIGDPQNGVVGMGHDLPQPLLETITTGILNHLKAAATATWTPGIADRANGGTRPVTTRPS